MQEGFPSIREHRQAQQINNEQLPLTLQINDRNNQNDEENPDIYNNFVQYVFSMVGYSVGFGTFWRFPYLLYKNGGGVFLIPYSICLFLIATPMHYLEVSVGQMSRLSQPSLYEKINKGLKMLGLTYFLINFTMTTYLNILLVYSVRFIITVLFNSQLKFDKQTMQDASYFHDEFLQRSSSIENYGNINLALFCLFWLILIVIYIIIKNGVKSSGKITMATAIIPYVVLLIMAIRGLLLPGASTGMKQLISPDFSKLLSFQTWADGFGQAFFGMGVSQAAPIALSSMKPIRQRIIAGVYITPLSLILCGALCVINVYAYIGNYCFMKGIQMSSLALQGVQLSFNVFPKILTQIPLPRLWLTVFFVTMVFLGIDSTFGMLKAMFVYVRNQFQYTEQRRICPSRNNGGNDFCFQFMTLTQSNVKLIIMIFVGLSAFLYCSSAGIYYLAFFDFFGTTLPSAIGVILEVILLIYVLPFSQTQKQVIINTSETIPSWISFIFKSHILLVLSVLTLFSALANQIGQYQNYPGRFYIYGWLYSLVPYVLALIYFLVYRESTFRSDYSQLAQREQQIRLQKIKKYQEQNAGEYIILIEDSDSSHSKNSNCF